jgi:hypothetical protein
LLVITSCTQLLVYETPTSHFFLLLLYSLINRYAGSYICVMKREFMAFFNDCCSSNRVTLTLVTKFLPQSTTNILIQTVTIDDVYRSAALVRHCRTTPPLRLTYITLASKPTAGYTEHWIQFCKLQSLITCSNCRCVFVKRHFLSLVWHFCFVIITAAVWLFALQHRTRQAVNSIAALHAVTQTRCTYHRPES